MVPSLRSGLIAPLACALALCACETSPDLVVTLRTDFLPETEFDGVEVEVAGSEVIRTSASAGDDFISGQRVFEGEVGSENPQRLVVTLRLADVLVAQRALSVEVRATSSATVVITRRCADVSCPAEGNSLTTTCLDGRCVRPGCLSGTEIDCGGTSLLCDLEDCPTGSACAQPICDNVCLLGVDDSSCGESEYCHPERGCLPRSNIGRDAAMSDGNNPLADAGLDASLAPDAATLVEDYLAFDGVDDFVEALDADELEFAEGDFTVEVRLRIPLPGVTQDTFLFSLYDGTHGLALGFSVDQRLRWVLRADECEDRLEDARLAAPINAWFRVFYLRIGARVEVWRDDSRQLNLTRELPTDHVAPDVRVGRAHDFCTTEGVGFAGDIDYVRLWNRALARADFSAIVAGSVPEPDSIVASWPMDEGSGQSLRDTEGENPLQLGATDGEDASDPEWR